MTNKDMTLDDTEPTREFGVTEEALMKAYHPPQLVEWGSLAELTKANLQFGFDGTEGSRSQQF